MSAISSCASAEFGIERDGFGCVLGSLAVKPIGRDQSEPDVRLRVGGILGERFVKESGRIRVVEALVKQHSPTNFVKSLAAGGLRGEAELRSSPDPILRDPRSLQRGCRRLALRVSASKQSCALAVCAMFAQRPAVRGD